MHKSDLEMLQQTLTHFPEVALVISLSQQDKDDFVQLVGQHFQLPIESLEDITYDYLSLLSVRAEPYLYVVSLEDFSRSQQDTLLKFLEEVPRGCRVILTATDLEAVNPTLRTRAILFELHRYTPQELQEYCIEHSLTNPFYWKVCQAFDAIEDCRDVNLDGLYQLCANIVSNISQATLPNTLSISSKYFFGENSLYSGPLFVTMMKIYLRDQRKAGMDVWDIYQQTLQLEEQITQRNVSRDVIFEHYLLRLWRSQRK